MIELRYLIFLSQTMNYKTYKSKKNLTKATVEKEIKVACQFHKTKK